MINIVDIFAFAQEVERNHAEFYRKAAEKAELPRSRRLLVTLAQKEEEHAIIFADMVDDFSEETGGGEGAKIRAKPTPDNMRQLRDIVTGQIFSQAANPSEYLSGHESTHEILQMAIDAENQTAEFYTLIGMTLADEAAKDKVEKILEEELKHIKFLLEVRGRIHK